MRAIHAEGASVCDAHPDPEVFRLRLGKALNYEYHEDSQTGLFQRRDPREGGAALDVERGVWAVVPLQCCCLPILYINRPVICPHSPQQTRESCTPVLCTARPAFGSHLQQCSLL